MTVKLIAPTGSPAVVPWFEREDPLWEPRLWAASSIGWRPFEVSSRKHLVLDANASGDGFGSKADRESPRELAGVKLARDAAGVLAQHHICSSEQIGAFCGVSAQHAQRVMFRLWRAGVVERGRLLSDPAIRYPYLWRLRAVSVGETSMQRREVDRFLDAVPFDDWVSITGGRLLGRPRGARGGRHELLVADLGLRCAEILGDGCAAVLGEHLASDVLLTAGTPAARLRPGRQGDLVMVRPDGFRVVFELVRSLPGLDAKVASWAELLASGAPEALGLSFVVVDARAREDVSRYGDRPLNMIRAGLERAGRAGVLARDRIGYASWSSEWFPGVRRFSDRFEGLVVRRLVGGDVWEDVSLLGERFEPADPDWWRAGVRNARLLAGCPVWLRERRQPGVFGRMDRPDVLRGWFASAGG